MKKRKRRRRVARKSKHKENKGVRFFEGCVWMLTRQFFEVQNCPTELIEKGRIQN